MNATSTIQAALQFIDLRVQIARHFFEHSIGGRLLPAQEFRHGGLGPVVFAGQRIQAHRLAGAEFRDVADQAIERHASWDAGVPEKETTQV